MTRIAWGSPSERFFETGVDRGVLFVNPASGVPWIGLISVTESPTGGEAKPSYLDGYKFRNISAAEEFAATIEAFSAPKEFGPCDGNVAIQHGLVATQQPRKAFGFSYRTKVGNALDGQNHGYKIHLVYNALSSPSERTNSTIGDSTEANALSWSVSTRSPFTTGLKPTAHFVIDSRYTPRGLLVAIEDIIYGTDAVESRMPLVSELIALFQDEGPLTHRNLFVNPGLRATTGTSEIRRNLATNPGFRTVAAAVEVRRNLATNPGVEGTPVWPTNNAGSWTHTADTVVKRSGTKSLKSVPVTPGVTTSLLSCYNVGGGPFAVTPGEAVTGSVYVAHNAAVLVNAQLTLYWLDASAVQVGASVPGPLISGVLGDSQFTARPWATGIAPAGATQYRFILAMSRSAGNTVAGDAAWADDCLIEKISNAVLPYFDGSTAATNGLLFTWAGTAHASASIASGQRIHSIVGGTSGTNPPAAWRSNINPGVSGWSAVFVPGSYIDWERVDTGQTKFGSGRMFTISARVWKPAGPVFVFQVFTKTAAGSYVSTTSNLPLSGTAYNGERVSYTVIIPASTDGIIWRTYYSPTGNNGLIYMSDLLIEEASADLGYFDGATPANEGLTYSFVGAANASDSVATGAIPNSLAFNQPTYYRPRVVVDSEGERFVRIIMAPTSISNTAPFASITPYITTAPDDVITFSVDIRGYGLTPGRKFTILLYPADAATALMSPFAVTMVSAQPLTDEWTRYSGSITMPPGSAKFVPYFYPGGPVVWQKVVDGVDIRRLRVSKNDVDITPLDGSMPDADSYYYSFEGAVDASPSVVHSWN